MTCDDELWGRWTYSGSFRWRWIFEIIGAVCSLKPLPCDIPTLYRIEWPFFSEGSFTHSSFVSTTPSAWSLSSTTDQKYTTPMVHSQTAAFDSELCFTWRGDHVVFEPSVKSTIFRFFLWVKFHKKHIKIYVRQSLGSRFRSPIRITQRPRCINSKRSMDWCVHIFEHLLFSKFNKEHILMYVRRSLDSLLRSPIRNNRPMDWGAFDWTQRFAE